MHIRFFDDPLETPNSREDVRIRRLGFFVHPERRRVSVGFELTPFIERPSIEIALTNTRGERAGTMTVIEALEPRFSLTVHLRDENPTEAYRVDAVLYFTDEPGTPRQVVQEVTCTFPAEPGEHIVEISDDE